MAETTAIEWTDSTFNPWWGCTKISPACDHCYAADLDKRTGGDHWGNVPRRRTSEKNWNDPRRWQKKAAEFQAAHGRRQRVFCASMADVFDNQVPTEWRDDLWALIRECPDLDWLLLTKRPQNIGKMLPSFWNEVKDHVWLGTTVEDQKRAHQNIPHLLQHDAAVRFVSIEPMLGPIDLNWVDFMRDCPSDCESGSTDPSTGAFECRRCEDTGKTDKLGIDWIIAGGESGVHARPSHPEWFRSLRDQCAAADVPFFFKQWGEWVSVSEEEGPGRHHLFDDGATVRRLGKRGAGRTLDGVEHNGFPEPRPA